MSLIAVLNLVAAIFFLAACVIVFTSRKRARLYRSESIPLIMAIGFYLFVCISNLMEHSGITAFFDPVEDIAEVLFCLVILFFANNWRAHRTLDIMQAQKEWLSVTLHCIGDGVLVTDVDGKVELINPAAQELTGWSSDDACGLPASEVLKLENSDGEVIANPILSVLEAGVIVGLAPDTVLVAKDGSKYQIADSGAPIRDSEGNVLGVVMVFRDVSEEIVLQEQLRHAQKMDAVGQLAGGIAHDFNNILGGIIGSAEILQVKMPPDPVSRKYLNIILESSERAGELVSRLLTFSRKQNASSDPVNVHQAIQRTVSILENTIDKRIEVEVDLKAEQFTVIGDDSLLQSSLLNLAINATHAMPEGGKLSFLTRVVELGPDDCSHSAFNLVPGLFIEVEVRDTGSGISRENLSRIFEPFFTTKPMGQGTGLGLSAVLGVVELHKGAIVVYSEADKGTCFRLVLPLAEKSARVYTNVTKVEKGTGVILVVDDEDNLRVTADALLGELGYTVLTAANGREAIDVFSQKHDKIDLVILDMVMPKMNGRECMMKIQDIKPDVKVIFSSGFSRDEDMIGLKSESISGFIRKPFRIVELSRLIKKSLRG